MNARFCNVKHLENLGFSYLLGRVEDYPIRPTCFRIALSGWAPVGN